MIALSLSEAGALGFKAARGAGMEWGMAEEARAAVVWAHARGLPGLQALRMAILCETAQGEAPGSALHAGVALSDTGALQPEGLHLEAVAGPVLLLPFVAHLEGCHRVQWRGADSGAQIMVQGEDIWCVGATQSQSAARVSITRFAEPPDAAPAARTHRAFIDGDTLAGLERLAQATYAPATEASRQRGAGGADDE